MAGKRNVGVANDSFPDVFYRLITSSAPIDDTL